MLTSMITATIKTLNSKEVLSKNVKQEALRFYFILNKERPSVTDPEWIGEYNKLVNVMRERKILNG